jgi:hypothetical protein
MIFGASEMPIPGKDFYTLDEIAECWACIRITKSSFLDLAKKDLLVFSIYEKDIGSHREITNEGNEIRTKTVTVLKFISSGYEYQSIRYLKSDDSRRILEAEPNQQIQITGSYSLPTRIKESGFGKTAYLTINDLGVSAVEKMRFENAHGFNSLKARLYRIWSWVKEPSNLKPLSMIGTVLVVAIGALWSVFKYFYKE